MFRWTCWNLIHPKGECQCSINPFRVQNFVYPKGYFNCDSYKNMLDCRDESYIRVSGLGDPRMLGHQASETAWLIRS